MRKTADLLAGEVMDLYSSGKAAHAYELFGCHYEPETGVHRFCLWAPHAKGVSVVGEFNGWDGNANPMQLTEDGVFMALVPGLSDGDTYKYLVSGYDGSRVFKADPFAFHSEVRPATASKVWRLDGYTWSDQRFLKERAIKNPVTQPLSIYEVHIGSWRKKAGYRFASVREVADELSEYAADMGYTHVQLLDFLEHPLDESGGMQVTAFFAPTSRYGTPQDYMYFVDKMHARGIGVLMSFPASCFAKDEHGLTHFDGTWLYEYESMAQRQQAREDTYAFNYGSPAVRSFLLSSAGFLHDVYHVDGLCISGVTSMLYPGYARDGYFVPNEDGSQINGDAVVFLQTLNETMRDIYKGAITIAGEDASFTGVTQPCVFGGLGFTFKWDTGFMRDTLDFMHEDPYMRGYSSGELTYPMTYAFSENYILPYPHQESAYGKKSMLEKMYGDYAQKFASLRALYGYFFAHPGKKLMFMGDEFGQFIEWDEKKQLDWFLLEYGSNAGLKKYVARLNDMYKTRSAFFEMDDSPEGFTWAQQGGGESSIYAFLRHAQEGHMLIVCNFMPVMRDSYRLSLPQKGFMKLVLNSDEAVFGGTGVEIRNEVEVKENENADGFRAVFDVPPLSAQYYEFFPEE